MCGTMQALSNVEFCRTATSFGNEEESVRQASSSSDRSVPGSTDRIVSHIRMAAAIRVRISASEALPAGSAVAGVDAPTRDGAVQSVSR